MAIRVRCPRCWETAEVPEEALGKQGMCNACGALVSIPARLTKVCFICGADVTHVKHAKDLEGNYLCLGCWETHNPVQRAVFSAHSVECSNCHTQFIASEGFERDGKPLCKECYRAISDEKEPIGGNGQPALPKPPQPQPRPAAAAAPAAAATPEASPDHVPGFEPPSRGEGGRSMTVLQTRSSPLAFIMATVALLVAIGVGCWQQFNGSSWEEENQSRLIALKAQAEVLVSVGKIDEGIEKYNQLFSLANGHVIRSVALNREIESARVAAQAAPSRRPDDWEEQNLVKILILKGQADLLVTLGRPSDAAARYESLLALVSGHQVRSTMLKQEITAARLGHKDALAKMAELERSRVAQGTASHNPDPQLVVVPVHEAPVAIPTTNPAPVRVVRERPDTSIFGFGEENPAAPERVAPRPTPVPAPTPVVKGPTTPAPTPPTPAPVQQTPPTPASGPSAPEKGPIKSIFD